MVSLISGARIAAQKLNQPAQKHMNSVASISNARQSSENEMSTEIDDIMWGHIDTAVTKRDGEMLRRVLNPMKNMAKDNAGIASDVKNLSKRTDGVNG